MESRKKTLKKKALKNKKENMQESNIYTIMHCRLARLYLSGNDVLSLPDDTEILVNVCRIYTQLADSTSALYAMEKDRQDCRHAKYVNSYNCCKKVLDRMEEQNQAERMFIINFKPGNPIPLGAERKGSFFTKKIKNLLFFLLSPEKSSILNMTEQKSKKSAERRRANGSKRAKCNDINKGKVVS